MKRDLTPRVEFQYHGPNKAVGISLSVRYDRRCRSLWHDLAVG